MDARLSPRFWRHDAYTLNQLRGAVAARAAALTASASSVTVDVGAGSAPYRSLFEQANARYVACDLEPSPGIEVVIRPGTPIALEDECADTVVSFQVLEHVWDLDWYLRECRRLLKPGGRLLLSTHGTWLFHPHPTDFRRWTASGLIREIEERGFEVESTDALVGPLAWTTQFRTLAYHHVLGRIPLVGPLLSGSVCAFMHLRMIIEDAITPPELRRTNAAVYLVVARPCEDSESSG